MFSMWMFTSIDDTKTLYKYKHPTGFGYLRRLTLTFTYIVEIVPTQPGGKASLSARRLRRVAGE
jgi:hypothetical protein